MPLGLPAKSIVSLCAASHAKRQGSQRRELQPAAATSAAARAAHASSQRRNLKRNLYGVRRVADPKWKTRVQGLFGRLPKISASGDLRRQPVAIVCEQKFSTTANVHDIDVRWHSCDMCEQKFKSAFQLKSHSCTTSMSGGIPATCASKRSNRLDF